MNPVSAHSDPIQHYLQGCAQIAQKVDRAALERMVDILAEVRERGGRLFILGVGGGAGHAGHAVCDFRKIAGIQAYSPSDNVSELTARTNDEGWETTYSEWLKGCRIGSDDAVLVFSVGGGDLARNISPNLVRALQTAQKARAKILGIVGRDGGFTAEAADACVIIPTVDPALITALTESFQAVLWHLLVSHPKLQAAAMKWESQQPLAASV
ncbi:MAG: SIS domain-containing protein [Verrucomicrobiae bacterium]|nr:SIS domain-containing protein [Verrucomicrobiae bacterium]